MEEYYICDVCGKTILKHKAIKMMYSRVCENCFDKILKNHEELRKKDLRRSI